MKHAEPDLDNVGGPSDHDSDNLQEDIQNLAQAMTLLADKIETMDKMYDALNSHVDTLDKLINDDFIGGLSKMYDDNDREVGIRSLQDKYGEQVGPYEGALKAFNPDMDVWSDLHNSLKELKGQPGYTDEAGDAHIKAILDGLGSRFGAAQASLSKVKPVATVTKVETAEPASIAAPAPEAKKEPSNRQLRIAEMLGKRAR